MNFTFVDPYHKNDIDYIMLEGSPTFDLSPEGLEATAEFAVRAADLYPFLAQLYGRIIDIDSGGGQSIRLPMYVHTYQSAASRRPARLYVDGLAVQPWGGQTGSDLGGEGVPTGARGLTTVANAPDFRVTDYYGFKVTAHFNDRDPFVEERIDVSGQAATIATKKLRYHTSQERLGQRDRPWFTENLSDWSYSIKRTLIVPPEVFTYRGKVNSETMWAQHIRTGSGGTITRQSFTAGQVLFENAELRPVFVPWGSAGAHDIDYVPYWRIDYHFLVNENGWNNTPCLKDNTALPFWDTLDIENGAGWLAFTMHDTADLRDLLWNPKTS